MDEETRRICEQYTGDINFDKSHEIVEEVLWETPGEWSLSEFQALINTATNKIPPQLMVSARIEFDDDPARLKIWYRRMQTESEVAQRVASCLKYAREVKERERATYEKLKAKFGG